MLLPENISMLSYPWALLYEVTSITDHDYIDYGVLQIHTQNKNTELQTIISCPALVQCVEYAFGIAQFYCK